MKAFPTYGSLKLPELLLFSHTHTFYGRHEGIKGNWNALQSIRNVFHCWKCISVDFAEFFCNCWVLHNFFFVPLSLLVALRQKVRFDGVNQLAFRLASILAGAEYVLRCCNRFALAIFAYELSKLDFIIAFGYTSSV